MNLIIVRVVHNKTLVAYVEENTDLVMDESYKVFIPNSNYTNGYKLWLTNCLMVRFRNIPFCLVVTSATSQKYVKCVLEEQKQIQNENLSRR